MLLKGIFSQPLSSNMKAVRNPKKPHEISFRNREIKNDFSEINHATV
jgi:hypothetical protein